jgi:protein-tyrosine-phosphatase
MAEAFTNYYAKSSVGRSAGTVAGKELNPIAVEAMNELGISMESQTPKLLTPDLIDWADRVITMGCGVNADQCPAGFMISEDWGLDDPAGQGLDAVREIRDQIRERVLLLLRDEEVG